MATVLVLVLARGRAQDVAQQSAKLVAADAAAGDTFGLSVAVDGDVAVVSARMDAPAGSAYVFEKQPDGSWAQVSKLVPGSEQSGIFGTAVAVDGDTAVVGDNGGTGSAYVFLKQPDGSWAQVSRLVPADAATGGGRAFGFAVAVDGDTIVIGAWSDSQAGNRAGAAYVFEKQPDGSWTQVTKLVGADSADQDSFGHTVAVSGDTIMIGSVYDDFGTIIDQGSVYQFLKQLDGSWVQVSKLVAADAAAGAKFGCFVAMDGETAVIGAFGDANAGSNTGAAYVFLRQPDGSWTQVSKLVAADAAQGTLFGYSVAVDGDTAVISAYRSSSSGSA